MRISFVNHLCSGHASIASNTVTSVGEEYQLERYKGLPLGVHSDGIITFEFSEVKQINFVGLFGLRWALGTLDETDVTVRIKLSGVTQDVHVFTLSGKDTYDVDGNFASILDTTYDCDEVQFEFNTTGGDTEYLSIRRLWVGTYIHFEKVGQTRLAYLDSTVYEESSTGGLFATQGRVRREIQCSEVVFEDSWFANETGTKTDFGQLVESLMQSGPNQEIAIISSLHDFDMHGKFANGIEFRKLSGLQFSTNLVIREF